MICCKCKYWNKGYCLKHGTRQRKNCLTSCGEYDIWDEIQQIWISGTIYYMK